MMQSEAAWRAEWDENRRTGLEPPLHTQLGFEVVQLSPTTVLSLELTDTVRGLASGSVHGGVLALFADVASAVALWNAREPLVEIPATTDMHIRYYRQPTSGPLMAEAKVSHRGRQLLSTECTITDGEGRVLASATATYVIVRTDVHEKAALPPQPVRV
jgi:uncharacterized protein (TIGR00369 family)